MAYLIPAATAAMLGYMLWLLLFRLRRDRVRSARDRTRGKFVLRPRERMRFLLKRSFKLAEDRPDWEDPLVSRLGGQRGQAGETHLSDEAAPSATETPEAPDANSERV